MGGGGGNAFSSFIEDVEDTARDVAKDVRANDLYDLGASALGGAADAMTAGGYSLLTEGDWTKDDALGSLLGGGVGAGAAGAGAALGALENVHDKAILDPRRDAERAAEDEARAAEQSRAQAILALPKDPSVEEIARQRRARGGRRGTILTSPSQTLGSTGQGKNLLGL